jgi:hypothetical protein
MAHKGIYMDETGKGVLRSEDVVNELIDKMGLVSDV